MSLNRRFAHFVTHRKRALCLAVGALAVICAAMIAARLRFASDVIDLLPQNFDSVRAFKTFDREFSQARELTFALFDEKHEADLDAFSERFAEELRKEPWIVRALDRSPMESAGGVDEVRAVALPLLLNLDSAEFDLAMSAIQPDAIAARLQKLHGELSAGSPKAEFELDFDPLGLVTPALKPLAGSPSMQQSRPLSSEDGTLRLVLARTNQTDLGAHACQETMRKVEAFKRQFLAKWDGPAPEILVTGRTPYVGELSLTMRGDVVSTIAGSVILVALVFYMGFRRIRPLGAIMLVLALCCLVAVALGGLVFHELNIITIGLCSILIGLGVDFGMMLYAIYERERGAGATHEEAIAGALRGQGRGVFFGSLTTAAAFLCFLLSESPGFAQLGVLITFGILAAALFMMTLFFALVGSEFERRRSDWLWNLGEHFVGAVYGSPRAWFLTAALALAALCGLALAPLGRLEFDANPKSLEPKDSHAGVAMRTILARMPITAEPLILLVESRGAEEMHERWSRLKSAFDNLTARGLIKSAASPAVFIPSPARVAANIAKLAALDLAGSRSALTDALKQEGMSVDSFHAAFGFLDALQGVARGDQSALNWRRALPASSSWWFVLDRFFARDPNLAAAYITPLKTLSSFAEKERIRAALEAPGVPMHISGWSYTMQDLVPWAKRKLTELSSVMIFFNVLLLVFLYRTFFPLFVLMASLSLAVGALVASLKLFCVPLNMFNVLAFPLVLGVGVDYGIYMVIAVRQSGDRRRNLATVVKPVLLSGLTTTAGFGSLGWAANPALRSLGVVCALGVAWCLVSTLFFVLPAYAWRGAK